MLSIRQPAFTCPTVPTVPDAAWVSKSRWEALSPPQQSGFPPLCPDFVVELRSRTDALPPLLEKMREYLEAGCQLGWLIDPAQQEVRIFRADGSLQILHGFEHTLSGEEVLPGFEFPLSLLG